MKWDFDTRCIHGEAHAWADGARSVSFPIYQTATFGHSMIGHEQFNYTRQDNPTRQQLEEVVASLEEADSAIAFSSGMAAIAALTEILRPGDHLVCGEDLYGGTTRLFSQICEKNGVTVSFVDTTDPAKLEEAMRPSTRLVHVETPSNPMMTVTDIRACADIAHAHGALLSVDNTFLSPVFQRPLTLGADAVLHSGSKYLSGHNDTIAGFLVLNDRDLTERFRLIAKTIGAALAPFDSWLVLRGLKTLHVRMQRQQENARFLAHALQRHPAVREVLYIGLPEMPGYAVNRRQTGGTGAMISFRVQDEATARRALERVRLITFAESLGGTESLLTYPLTQTHCEVPEALRRKLRIDGTLLRLSVGLENAEDLLADLTQALEA
ncbi:MAG: PLP-dependent transferase [Oscillospiraceae bacterium]|nr:PLP-dependent transferase [Oscillospiraceae bacterium]